MKSSNLCTLRLLALLVVSVFLNALVMRSAEGAIRLDPVLSGLSSPVYVTNADDGSNRLFVVQQGGQIRALAADRTTLTLFLDITSRVLSGGERGLLGLAFHPQFATNSRFFVYYTNLAGSIVIAEYHALATPAATAASEIILLTIAHPGQANHNGGMIEFGPDGYLYAGTGDGGSANDPPNNAQNINVLLGKILRIDVDHPNGNVPYSSPASNPFFGITPGADEIFAFGMRNPFRFSFDRGGTHQLYVGDVGQGLWEEVDIVTVGGNYGWRVYEGNQHCTGNDSPLCTPTNYVAPIAEYGHTGGRCSITGGYVYRGSAAAVPAGTYVFGDYCTGEIFSLASGVSSLLLDTTLNISSFGEDEAGELYVVGLGGTVHRIASTATTTTLTSSGSPAPVGSSVIFTATVAGSNPTGSVTFTEGVGGTAICAAGTLSGIPRTASCSTSSLAVGVHSIVANYAGDAANAASSSTPLSQVINSVQNAATFVGTDVATKGNWHGVYGADGYAIINDSSSYPAYAQVTPTGQQSYVWNAQPGTDPRALQRATSGRIAACWYSPGLVGGSFSVDVNLTDGAAHRVALYLLDWDSTTRVNRVDVLDAATQQVLSTQTLQSFNGGVYLVWNLQGHVILRFTSTGGSNAVLSGLFFDAPASLTTYTVSGTVTTGGNPLSGVNLTATGTASCPGASNAQGQYSCTVPQGWSGSITPALSGYAFTPTSRSYSSVAANQSAQDYAATSTVVPNTATFVGTDVATKGNWHGVYGADGYAILNDSTSYPAYAQVTPTGQQSYVWAAQPDSDPRALQRGVASGRIAACWYSPGLVGGSFSVDVNLTDGAAHRVALYLLDWDSTTRVNRVDVLDAATQQVLSTQTLQSFNGGVYLVWNLQGHVILRFTSTGGSNAVLSGLFFDAPASLTTYTVSGTVTTGGNPLSGVNLTATGTASCPGASNAQGNYSCTVPQGWSGSITPALSGYAFTPTSRSYSSIAANLSAQDYTATTALPNGATFVGTDVATQGNWHGVYGVDGYAIINDSTSYPAYAQVTPTGQQSYVWNAQPGTDPRALQRATSGRIAACWYSPGLVGGSFSVDVNLTDGAAHRVALYLLDWDTTTRVNRVDVLDAATQQVLSTQTLQSFNGGVYLVWNLQGHVILRFTSTGGSNAVLSGLFFDAPASLTTYTVSGTVTTGGNPLSGVNLTATGTASCPAASNPQGQYSCTVPQGWSGSITPALSGYAFTPTSRSYSSVAANQNAQDYTASAIVGGSAPWNTFSRDAQHTALSTTASQPLNQVHWQTPMDLQPQYTGTSLLIHYGSPLVTSANTVIVPVKTGAAGGFKVEARGGSNGALKWSMTTDYILPPASWIPAFGPALTSQPRLYFPGAGGTVYFRDQPDATSGASGQIAFYGLSNYQANPQAYNASVFINTPITSDPSGNTYFGFHVTGSTPLGLSSGIARISANGVGTATSVITASADPAMTKVPHNSAPALSADLGTLYVAVSNGTAGYLVALDSTTLAPLTRVRLKDSASGLDARLSDNGSASPTVGTDGDVYFGVLENPQGSNHSRGWLLHFNGSLSQSKTPGAFGWDDTASLVPGQMVPSYQGTSAYLLMAKYNNYAGRGGDGQNKLAVLDPNATQTDPVTLATVMKEVLTIVGPTPDPDIGGVREWCINSAVVDPVTKSILANNEDGKLYRWDLTTNTLSQTVVLTAGLGEAYTSTVIGVDGHVYAINNAILFAVGQ